MKKYRINSKINNNWHRNFFNYHTKMSESKYGFTREEIKKFLQPWNARYIIYRKVSDIPRGHTIEFKTEKDMMLFLLRWS